jgi:starch synthase
MTSVINVLFVAAEAEPFVKIGGLADVAGSLPLALRNLPVKAPQEIKLDVRLALPFHRSIRVDPSSLRTVAEFLVPRKDGHIPAQVFEGNLAGMPVYFISGEPILSSPFVYTKDLAFDREKFAFFSIAVMEFVRSIDWRPDIIHANDWHTALSVYALNSMKSDPVFEKVRSVLTLHNLPYMGGDGSDVLDAYQLEQCTDTVLPLWARSQPLPLGLWAADMVVPVSPTYAKEILTPEFGCGLDPMLKECSNKITGILNGLDVTLWDPKTDPNLPSKFSFVDLSGRKENKHFLQEQMELNRDPDVPLMAMIGRIDPQKGVDVAIDTLNHFKGDWQLIILGSGDTALENAALALQENNPENVRVAIRYDANLSRLIYGGADMLLMPSRYEPCGLAQMIAMRYGCVPVVRATGGLKDTVRENQTGFQFDNAEPASMTEALDKAFSSFTNREEWETLQRNGMQEDFSWPRFAAQYAAVYKSLLL